MILSVIIPAHNEECYLANCLRSVAQELGENQSVGRFELIVVVNACTDRTAEIAASFPGVRVVYEPRKGLTRARQRGLEEAQGEILAYVDADTRMPQGWIQRVLNAYRSNHQVVCVSGPYIFYDMSSSVVASLTKLYWFLIVRPAYWLTRYMVIGGNFAARRTALVDIGGFDTTIAFYGEDVDIARRLAETGIVVFDMALVMETSARRFRAEGFIFTTMRYIINFLAEAILKRPATTTYRDIR
jgi:glycosyltransferase involved in cell wall biosynthesis